MNNQSVNIQKIATYRRIAIEYLRDEIMKKKREIEKLNQRILYYEELNDRVHELLSANAKNAPFLLTLKFLFKIIFEKIKKKI